MNLLFTINKSYIKQLNILLYSIQYSNPEEKFNIYIIHKELNEKDLPNITRQINLSQFNIKMIKIPKSEIGFFPVYEKRYPIEIYFRLFASKYLPNEVDKILYLDSDTLVINNLKKLYEIPFEGNFYIGSTHTKKIITKINKIRLKLSEKANYVNTGVLLINLNELRKIDVENEVINYVKNNKGRLLLPDQDIISALYGEKIKLVDAMKYNLGDRALKIYNRDNPENKITLKWIKENTVILHYYGRNKPWNKNYSGVLDYFYNNIINKMENK